MPLCLYSSLSLFLSQHHGRNPFLSASVCNHFCVLIFCLMAVKSPLHLLLLSVTETASSCVCEGLLSILWSTVMIVLSLTRPNAADPSKDTNSLSLYTFPSSHPHSPFSVKGECGCETRTLGFSGRACHRLCVYTLLHSLLQLRAWARGLWRTRTV